MKKAASLVLCLLICTVVCLSVLPTRASAASARSTSFYDYTSGLTNTTVANVPFTENGVQRSDQTQITLCEGADGGKYAVFYPNYDGKNPAHGFATVAFPTVYFADSPRTDAVESVNAKYLLLEMDFTTESEYIDGLTMQLIARNHTGGKDNPSSARNVIEILKDANGFYLKTDNAKTYLPEERGVWRRLSILADIPQTNLSTAAAYMRINIYLDGRLIDSNIQAFTNDGHIMSQLRINQNVNVEVSKANTFCFDNVLVKTFDEDAEIASILSEGRDLVGFSGSNCTENYDFPSAVALFDVDGKKYGSVPELLAALSGGETVTVLRNVLDTVEFTKALTLKNPNGYTINYTAAGLTEIKDGTTSTFYADFTEMTVKWHIGDEVIEEVYTSVAKASFKGTYPETKVVDGVTYCAVGFARSEGGEVLSDLGYVSESNNEFWLVYSAPIASITRATGAAEYAYSVAAVETWLRESTSGEYILLNSDITLASYTYNSKVCFTLDLGGHKLTQAANASNHVFILLGAGSNITVKNGAVDVIKNIAFSQQDRENMSVTLENLKITSVMSIADIRSGILTIRGCTASFTGNFVTMFGAPDNSTAPSLVVENSTISASSTLVTTSTKDAATRKYSTVTVKNSTVTATTLIGASFCNAATLDGGKYTCTTIISCGADGATLSMTNGTEIAYQYLSAAGGDDVTLTLDNGCALAKKAGGAVVTDKYATVGWDIGADFASEVWCLGETPVCPFEIPEGSATVKYTFPEIMPVTEDVTYTLTAVPAFVPKMNLTLSLDFDLGVYIPAQAEVISITIGGVTHTYEEPKFVTVDGVTYKKYTFYGITPDTACDYVSLSLVLSGGDFSIEANYEISLVGYLKTILAGGYSAEAEMLAAAVAGYIDRAYIYAEKTADVAYMELVALGRLYNLDVASRTPDGEVLSMEAVNGAISSARLVLDTDLAFRFGLNSEYTGRIRLSYFYEGERIEREITVTNGKYKGQNYLEITLDAADLREKITFSISDGMGGYLVGEYSLYTYIDAMSGEDAELDALLRALYSYSVAAENYKSKKA